MFESSNDPKKLTTLKDYVARMKEGSELDLLPDWGRHAELWRIRRISRHFVKKGYEVLYLMDPVDEMFVQWVPEFEGKKLKSHR